MLDSLRQRHRAAAPLVAEPLPGPPDAAPLRGHEV